MSGSSSSKPADDTPPDRSGDHLLELTVHSMPQPERHAQPDARQTRIGRLKMLAVLAVCAAPVIASYFTYYVIRPEGRRNYGELINPQRALPDFDTRTLDGKALKLSALKGQWLLVSVSGAACDPACEKHLYLQRQLREVLGKDKDRMDWVWLINDDAAVRPELLPGLKTATVLRLPAQSLAAWLQPQAGHQLADHLYVVDPLGNWMMRFPSPLDPNRARRDLERLLRASASWDQPGR